MIPTIGAHPLISLGQKSAAFVGRELSRRIGTG
jgi:hypothetical protein